MPFTDLFIRRPVLAIVTSLMLLLLGFQSARELTLREFPLVETSTIEVRTQYPGASARTVLGFVTTPLQRYVSSARGIDYVTSTSRAGSSRILLHVRLGEDASDVLSEVIAKANESRYELPEEIEDPVIAAESGEDALMYLAFYSEELSLSQVNDYLARFVQPVLTTLEGVGAADLLGKKEFAMRIWLNPQKMAAYGVTAADIRDALRRDNYISTTGNTEGTWVVTNVEADTDLSNPAEFSAIVIRQEEEQRVLLEDVAELELSNANIEYSSFSSGREALFIAIRLGPGANPLAVASEVRSVLPDLEEKLPADLGVFVDYDGSEYIREALYEVIKTLIEAAAIVILVIYLFLGSIRVVVIPLVAIPLSLIGVLFLIYLLGFSINLLTLLAMVIAIGLVVDDAIVVVENVHRHIEDGASPLDAALRGAREVALPVLAMTLTLIAVYAPIGFLGGLTGALFTEFALTLAGAVFVSGVVALTLSPVMCANTLKESEKQGNFSDWLDGRFLSLKKSYRRALSHSLSNSGAVILFSLAIASSLPILFGLSQEELSPEEDSASIMVMANAPQYANLDYIDHFLDQLVEIWKQIPEVTHSWQVSSTRFIFGGLSLAHWNDRTRSQEEIMGELQHRFADVSGLEVFIFPPAMLPGAESGLPVDFVIVSNDDYIDLNQITEEVLQRARQSGIFAFVTKTLKFTRPETGIAIDRAKAARLGVSMRAIGDTLSIMLGEAEVNRFSMSGRSYKVIPQAAPDFRLTSTELEKYYVRAADESLIPLSTVISLEQRVEPNVLTQYQQLNSASIRGMTRDSHSMGEALAFLEKTLDEVAPSGYRAGYEGEARRFLAERSNFGPLFGLSLFVIFLVLSAQFNSFRDPVVVLIAVPLSIFGAVVPIALGMTSLNIYSQIGLLTLIGLISKHGILIVDFANELRDRGSPLRDAIMEAAALRLRPILMTTAATILGVAPLLNASGAGGNSRFSIGLMIAAGMSVGTLFTLFVLPTFYVLLAKERSGERLGSDAQGHSLFEEPAARAPNAPPETLGG
jgi:multidrug efflux pump